MAHEYNIYMIKLHSPNRGRGRGTQFVLPRPIFFPMEGGRFPVCIVDRFDFFECIVVIVTTAIVSRSHIIFAQTRMVPVTVYISSHFSFAQWHQRRIFVSHIDCIGCLARLRLARLRIVYLCHFFEKIFIYLFSYSELNYEESLDACHLRYLSAPCVNLYMSSRNIAQPRKSEGRCRGSAPCVNLYRRSCINANRRGSAQVDESST